EDPRAIRILVSFGAEDERGLSIPVVQGLMDFVPANWITLVIGPKNRLISQEERNILARQGVQILESPSRLAETLCRYDLLITHFGLTAFEALAARLPVALVSPTGYHEVLSLSAGLYSFGYGRRAAARAGRLLVKKSHYQSILEMSREATQRHIPPQKEPMALAAALSRWTFPGHSRCPLCHDRQPRHRKVLARFSERTYFRCKTCGITYMSRPNEPPITYDGAYFLEDYKKQYGKTYIEDFPNLVRMARSRLERIQSLLPHTKTPEEPVRLLDIGCAYGPFLAAGRDLGWAVRGLDPSADAVRYVQDHVGVPVLQGLFPETDLSPLTGGQAMDVVTLWYVIEHFQDLGAALEGAAALLKKGGILAFSTPSGSGVSGRARPHSFLEHSPPDHWTIWSPAKSGPILKRFGFRLVKTVNTGHHPERFPLLGPFAKSQKTVIYRVLYRISQIFSLGDTFEAYAIKE
ncbi:MAG: methyltransferase domain-containing protein, partial [Treponema sp.]|nr:methyltransferase domain-containing protein [Treponema sp.]